MFQPYLISANNEQRTKHKVLSSIRVVRKGGLEPPHLSVPDPKSGASANSATFANTILEVSNPEEDVKSAVQEVVSTEALSPAFSESETGWLRDSGSAARAARDSVKLGHCVRHLGFTEHVFAGLLLNQSSLFQFEVRALNLALIYGEL